MHVDRRGSIQTMNAGRRSGRASPPAAATGHAEITTSTHVQDACMPHYEFFKRKHEGGGAKKWLGTLSAGTRRSPGSEPRAGGTAARWWSPRVNRDSAAAAS